MNNLIIQRQDITLGVMLLGKDHVNDGPDREVYSLRVCLCVFVCVCVLLMMK